MFPLIMSVPTAALAAAAGEEALSTGGGGADGTTRASALASLPWGDRLAGESGEQRNDAICAVSSALPKRATVSTSSTRRFAQAPATAVIAPALLAWTARPVPATALGAATLAATATTVEGAANVPASGVAPGTVADVEDEANEALRYLPRNSTSSSAGTSRTLGLPTVWLAQTMSSSNAWTVPLTQSNLSSNWRTSVVSGKTC